MISFLVDFISRQINISFRDLLKIIDDNVVFLLKIIKFSFIFISFNIDAVNLYLK